MADVNTKLTSFAEQVAEDIIQSQELDKQQDQRIGDLNSLKTANKSSAVDAINELQTKIDEATVSGNVDFTALFRLALS